MRTKIERNTKQEFFLIEIPLRWRNDYVTDRQFIEGGISCQADEFVFRLQCISRVALRFVDKCFVKALNERCYQLLRDLRK